MIVIKPENLIYSPRTVLCGIAMQFRVYQASSSRKVGAGLAQLGLVTNSKLKPGSGSDLKFVGVSKLSSARAQQKVRFTS